MKRILFFIAVLAAPVAHADHWDVKTMNEAINQTNFIVGGGNGHCSGTLISLERRLILTNHHCIDQYVRYRTKEVVEDGVVVEQRVEELRDVTISQRSYADYETVGESSYETEIVARWKGSDLALLQMKAEDIPHNQYADVFSGEDVLRGETIYVVGNPQMLDTSVTKGIISSTQRTFRVRWANNEKVPFIQVDSGITGGNSGGALYNEHGTLIGVPAARGRDSTIGLAIPYFQIQKFLSDNCWEQVWDEDGESRDACMEEKEDEPVEVSSTDTSGCDYATFTVADTTFIRGNMPFGACKE